MESEWPAMNRTERGEGMPGAFPEYTAYVDSRIAEAREQVVTLAGTFQTVRVQPIADAGVVKNRGNIWIWYTDDERRMPVQMRARLFWGTMTMRLVSASSK